MRNSNAGGLASLAGGGLAAPSPGGRFLTLSLVEWSEVVELTKASLASWHWHGAGLGRVEGWSGGRKRAMGQGSSRRSIASGSTIDV